MVYTIAQQKEIKVCDSLVESDTSEEEWQVLALRNLNSWESGEYEELLAMLSLITLDASIDTPRWCLTSNGSFLVKPFYKKLFVYEDDDIIFPFRQM